jgi:hypothetical protein
MEQSKESRRQELIAARDNVQREINVLRSGPHHGQRHADNKALIAKLTATLQALQESLADLESDNARGPKGER